jgi:hypothetical protein
MVIEEIQTETLPIDNAIALLDPGQTLCVKGYHYSRNRRSESKSYFRCSRYQTTKCLGRIIVSHTPILPFTVQVKGCHTCSIDVYSVSSILDVTEEMKL